jgi:hypothetical protein
MGGCWIYILWFQKQFYLCQAQKRAIVNKTKNTNSGVREQRQKNGKRL